MEQVKLILDSEKCAQLPSAEHHSYDDKFSLVERFTHLTLASQVNSLGFLGLDKEKLRQAKTWAETSQVSIRFRAEERCSFLREETRQVEDPTKHVSEISMGGVSLGLTSKTVTKVTEFFWKFEVAYQLEVFRGVGSESSDRMVLQSNNCNTELKTTSKVTPQPEVKVPSTLQEANITFLLRHTDLGDLSTPVFKVDRVSKTTKTPRRNAEVDAAMAYVGGLGRFMRNTVRYLNDLAARDGEPSTANLSTEAVLVPALPLFVSGTSTSAPAVTDGTATLALVDVGQEESGCPVISAVDSNRLLAEEMRNLQAKQQDLAQELGSRSGVFALPEAVLVVLLQHGIDVTQQWAESMNYVEAMLRQQLVAAIGKEVTVADFAAYMRFHYRKVFQDAYLPAPFSFAVRRSELHSPEGTLSIEEEATGGSTPSQPVCSMSSVGHAQSVTFDLNASTTVSFSGDVHLHAWLAHQFSGQSGSSLALVSRARQFSSYIVMVGRIVSATQFDPTYAILVQNKDELGIPLDLSTIPTSKEFKDAIESLSPEQQAFAKAFRAMQLESTLFGVVVVQVKPQLEELLKLPEDSLTKEIKLTQDLMQLFIKYQIPSDLLSFSEDLLQPGEAATAAKKLEIVKGQVAQMNGMIAREKQEELEERRKEEEFKRMEQIRRMEEERCRKEAEEVKIMQLEERCMMLSDQAVCLQSAPKRSGGMMGGMMRGMASAFGGASAERCAASPAPGGAMPRSAPMPSVAATAAPPVATTPTIGKGRGKGGAPNACPKPTVPSSATAPAAMAPVAPVGRGMEDTEEMSTARDYTQVPKQMDEQFEKLDPTSSLRPTIISCGKSWAKRSQPSLLSAKKTEKLETDQQKKEKDAAFDLLDAITKSGALPLSHATLHIVVAATHCFDKTVTETVIQENLNPIERVECSSLIMASTVHQQPVAAMIKDSCRARIKLASPQLMDDVLKVQDEQ